MKKVKFIGMLLIVFIFSLGGVYGAGFTSISDHNVKVSDLNTTVSNSAITPIKTVTLDKSYSSPGISFYRFEALSSNSSYDALNSSVLKGTSFNSDIVGKRHKYHKDLSKCNYIQIPIHTYSEVDNSHIQNKFIKETKYLTNTRHALLLHISNKDLFIS